MSNKPAPRCPGCRKEMELRWQSYYGGIASMWYACDCGWRSPNGDDENEAYDKAMKRYKPVYDVYQGTAHEQGWPDQRAQTLHGGGELNFDVPPGMYPMVCQSTRETEEGHAEFGMDKSTPYCPHCGAKMDGEDNRDVDN